MTKEFYTENRKRFLDALNLTDESGVILFAGLPRRRTADESYPFYASRDFVYLTGLEQEDLVYFARQKNGKLTETIFVPAADPSHERWTGRMLHTEQVEPISGIEVIKERKQFETALREMLYSSVSPALYFDFDPPSRGICDEPAQKLASEIRRDYPFCAVNNCHPFLMRQRAIKRTEELNELAESIRVTGEGIRAMLCAVKPGMYEYQLRGIFEAVLADKGLRTPAFSTIIGAGKNSLVMHYPEQDCRIEDGDIILADLGAQFGHCGADITRMFPANGKFTERQKLLHDMARDNADYLLGILKPGMTFEEAARIGDEELLPKLKALGLAEELKDVRKYRWHSRSHHLGFDVHDDCDYDLPFAAGMVITMEVGLYVEPWGEGVRVEDDFLFTEDGCVNLSAGIPRTTEEIEAIMAEARGNR